MLIDTHCHLTSPDLLPRLPAVLAAAHGAGVGRMILVAVNVADARVAVGLLARWPELALVLGVHPHEAGRCDEDELRELTGMLRGAGIPPAVRARIVGVGETGLDFHYDFAPRARQEQVFRAQLALAEENDVAVVIHARESEGQVCDILAEYPKLAGRVVFHCFSGDRALAQRALDLGCHLSFTGVVTFKKAAIIQDAARFAPADRIMVETDAPYLSPEPMRKVRPNEPALLVHTARFLAELRGMTFDALAATSSANAERFFRLPEKG
jgi:TatD DNase family protein